MGIRQGSLRTFHPKQAWKQRLLILTWDKSTQKRHEGLGFYSLDLGRFRV